MQTKSDISVEESRLYKDMKSMSDDEWLLYVHKIRQDHSKELTEDLKSISKSLFDWDNRDKKEIALRPKCFIACLAFWSFSEAKQLNWMAYTLIKESIVFEAIKQLKIEWISKYMNHVLDQNYRMFDNVRPYYVEGLIPKPKSDNYIVGLISIPERMLFGNKDNTFSLYNFLLTNRDVLDEDFWKIFEIQGTAEANMSSIEKYRGEPAWDQTIKMLIENGHLEKKEVLSKTFDPLKNEWIQFRSGWFSRFHEFLAPSLEERKYFENEYLYLLSNAIGPTKYFGLKALNILSKNKLLDANKYLDQVDHVLISEKKGVVTTAISILERIAKNDTDKKQIVAKKVVQGLLSTEVDVQKRIHKLLGSMPAHDITISEELEKYETCIMPSMKQEFAKWLNGDVLITEENALEEQSPPFETIREKIIPIQDPQELVYHISKTLESPSNIADIELIYQSAFSIKEFPVELLSPIKKRAEHWFENFDGFSFTRGFLANFLLSWIHDFKYDISYDSKYDSIRMSKIFLFQKERLNNYIQLKRKGKKYTPLSIPSIRPYFIDGNSFLDRLIANQGANLAVDEWDLIQAITRLELNQEFDATKLQSLNGEIRDLTEFILKQGEYKVDKYYFAWLAAARTISPFKTLNLKCKHSAYHEVTEPVKINWDIEIDEGQYHHDKIVIDKRLKVADVTKIEGVLSSFNPFKIGNSKAEGINNKLIYPIQLLNTFDGYTLEYWSEMDIKWMLSSTPNKQDGCFASASKWIGSFVSYSSVSDIPSKYFLEDLCLSSQPLTEMKILAVSAGLGSSEKSVKAMATEALIIAINQDRIDLTMFGDILDRLISTNYMRLNRLVPALTTVSSISGKHSRAIQEIIFCSIKTTSPDSIPKNFKKLLELLLELIINNDATDLIESKKSLLSKYSGVNNLKKVIKSLNSV